ncbi:MAG TPA: hypothetical protein VGF14_04245 [Alphaproteobacteria bacterium]
MAKKGTGKKPPQKNSNKRKPTETYQAPPKKVPAYQQAAKAFIDAGADKTGMTFNQIARTVRYDMQ